MSKTFFGMTMMLVLFDNTTSSDDAMNAVTELRSIASKQCFIAGMTGVVTDIKNVAMQELPIYVVIVAVLQLGVTMDYSIFLLNSYEENKLRFPGDKERAMGHAISNTFKSVAGSSVTTVAGFLHNFFFIVRTATRTLRRTGQNTCKGSIIKTRIYMLYC